MATSDQCAAAARLNGAGTGAAGIDLPSVGVTSARAGADRDVLPQRLAESRADWDTQLAAVIDRLRQSVAAGPRLTLVPTESLNQLRATVLECTGDLARLRDEIAHSIAQDRASTLGRAESALAPAGERVDESHR
jgi:hypothetical protein